MSLFSKLNDDIGKNWIKESADRLLRYDGCEVILTRQFGRKSFWTAMVPAMQEWHAWCSLADEAGIMKFPAPAEAIKAVEAYLMVYKKNFPQPTKASYYNEKIDLSAGLFRVSGRLSGGNPSQESK